MNLFAIAGLSVVISCAILSLIILFFGKTRLHRLLLNLNLVLAVWGAGMFLVGIADSEAKAINAWKIAHLGGVFIGPLVYHLVSRFCGKVHRKMLFFTYVMAFFSFAGIIWTDYIINEVRYVFGLYYNVATSFYLTAAIGTYFAPVLFTYYKLFRFLERTRCHKRLQTQYIMFSFMFGFVGGGSTFLPMFQINLFYPFGNFGITLYASVLTYAILRHRLMDIHLMFRRTMVYSLSVGLLTGLFLLLIMIMSNYISDFTGNASLWVSCIAALIIAMLFNPLKNRIQLLIDKVFYKTRYDYYSTIQKAGSDLVALIRASDIQDYILQLIFKTLKVKSAYFLSMDGGYFNVVPSGFPNDKLSTEDIAKKLDSDSELVRLLKTSKNIIIKEELVEVVENEEIDLLAEELKPFNGKIAVPFFIEDRLDFILILGEKLSGDFYSDEDINLLSTISSQAAVSLKNAMLYGELEQRVEDRTAELSKANKQLEDFTKVVSHDLQEPLWKVKMFGDLLKAGYSETLGEKGRDYMERMYGAVTRMQQLINDLLALSRVTITAQPNISVDLNRVVREVLVDLEMRIEQIKGRIETDELPVIDADPSQMRQLFQNLIGNALKFHSNGRSPVIKISGQVSDVDSCTIMIEDNGIGFDVDYLDYIFGVFQRLHERGKYKGTGMGLAICRKIVERHGGNIAAKSIEGQGATFLVTLPVRQTSVETG